MALENAHSAAGGAASPSSNITEVDGFPIEEVPNPAVREQSSAEDPYQNDGAGDTLDWVIEGGEDLDGDTSRHMLAFYKDLKAWYCQRNYTSVLLTKFDYDQRVAFCLDLVEDGDCRSQFLAGNSNAYKWAKKYHVVTVGEESSILVLRPDENQQKKKKGSRGIDVTAMRLEDLQQPSYAEKLFVDLWKIHRVDHCKGNSLFTHVKNRHGNITREVCKMFTDVCPQCVKLLSRKKPVAGIKNIVTEGFGVRGQVDLIDFQSMPVGAFKFLLNYIDHGVKELTSIPLTSKRASSVAFALLTIFTDQGPPSILQSDNGKEFTHMTMSVVPCY